jgi:hypothetical protein
MLSSTPFPTTTSFRTVKRPYPEQHSIAVSQIRQVSAAITIQSFYRGYLVRKDIKAVKTIFNQIEDEINFQVFGTPDKNLINESLIQDLKCKRELLAGEQQRILQAFYNRLAELEMI